MLKMVAVRGFPALESCSASDFLFTLLSKAHSCSGCAWWTGPEPNHEGRDRVGKSDSGEKEIRRELEIGQCRGLERFEEENELRSIGDCISLRS
ncbi:hypothetical protein ACLOJK_012515 [Asimina triloba]